MMQCKGWSFYRTQRDVAIIINEEAGARKEVVLTHY
jgi:hypothetical protein